MFIEDIKHIRHNMKLQKFALTLLQLTALSYLINYCDAGQLCSSCNGITRLSDCHRFITCDDGEQCYHRQYTNMSGSIMYDLGCISSQACAKNPVYVGKRSGGPHLKCFSCCNDTALCNQMSDCRNALPHQTVCASCSKVSSPMDCLNQETCANNERCYAYKFSTGIGSDFYDVGCTSASACLSSPEVGLGIKRSEDHHAKCIKCCNVGNMCNRNLTCGETVPTTSLAHDCGEINQQLKLSRNGSYTIYPYGVVNESVSVYCEFDRDGPWTIIQRRFNGSVNFYRNWKEYKRGFGSSNGEYWLGNDFIHQLTSHGNYTLKIVLTDWNNTVKYAKYSVFRVGGEANNYNLTIGGYSGDAGDSMDFHNGGQFSTLDRENERSRDNCVSNCGHGAWWHTDCCHASLNAEYHHYYSADSIYWLAWHGWGYSLKGTKMMIQRN